MVWQHTAHTRLQHEWKRRGSQRQTLGETHGSSIVADGYQRLDLHLGRGKPFSVRPGGLRGRGRTFHANHALRDSSLASSPTLMLRLAMEDGEHGEGGCRRKVRAQTPGRQATPVPIPLVPWKRKEGTNVPSWEIYYSDRMPPLTNPETLQPHGRSPKPNSTAFKLYAHRCPVTVPIAAIQLDSHHRQSHPLAPRGRRSGLLICVRRRIA